MVGVFAPAEYPFFLRFPPFLSPFPPPPRKAVARFFSVNCELYFCVDAAAFGFEVLFLVLSNVLARPVTPPRNVRSVIEGGSGPTVFFLFITVGTLRSRSGVARFASAEQRGWQSRDVPFYSVFVMTILLVLVPSPPTRKKAIQGNS